MSDPNTDYQKYLEEVHSKLSLPEEVLNQTIKDMTGSDPVRKEKIVRGEANEVYDITTQSGDDVIVRIERRGPGFLQEKWAIEQASKVGVPVPEILGITKSLLRTEKLTICIQKKIQGGPLERGEINIDELDKDYLRKIVNQAGEILAKIHSISTQGFDRINGEGVGEFKTFKDMIMDREAQREEYLKLAQKISLDPKIIDKAMSIISDHQDLYPDIKPCLNHGDFGPKHIMVKGNEITGILDWGEANGNSPIDDIARWDYWYGDWIPTAWLKEGYTNKSIFDENYDLLSRLINLRRGLILIYWYDEFKYPAGVEKAKTRLIKDLEYFK